MGREIENPLYRIDNQTWQYEFGAKSEEKTQKAEIKPKAVWINSPFNDKSGKAHQIALMTWHTLNNNDVWTTKNFSKPYRFFVSNQGSELDGEYEITQRAKDESWGKWFKQQFPMTSSIENQHVAILDVKKKSTIPLENVNSVTMPLFDKPVMAYDFEFKCKDASLLDRTASKPFTDPFTKSATAYLQTRERRFVAEPPVQSDEQYILKENGNFTLVPVISNPTQEQKEQNRFIVKQYENFIRTEYGQTYLDYIHATFGFNLEEMQKNGEPLLPDHVYKVNVGVNNLEQNHVEGLYANLKKVQKELKDNKSDLSIEALWDSKKGIKDFFSIREIRGLIKLMQPKEEIKTLPTVHEFKQFLDKILGENPPALAEDLDPKIFNNLINIFWLPPEQQEAMFTGRMIKHLAVWGYQTMGNLDDWDPVRDLHELLQVMAVMQETNLPDLDNTTHWNKDLDKHMDHFLEMLANACCKKHIFRTYPGKKKDEKEWQVGSLIPGPYNGTGEQLWYRVQSVLDDDSGDFNYFLVPACNKYIRQTNDGSKALEAIKLFRSTAANKGCVSGTKSVDADFQVTQSPNSMHPGIADKYAMPAIYERTIPVWVGYLLYGNQNESLESYLTALNEYDAYMKQHKKEFTKEQNEILKALESEKAKLKKMDRFGKPANEEEIKKQVSEIKAFLTKAAKDLKEMPENKSKQDIINVGHSLGGALAQFFTNYIYKKGRMPCPGNRLFCYSLNPPGVDYRVNNQLMAFGRKHQAMLNALSVLTFLFKRFEKGDIIGASGEIHTGSGAKEEDKSWLKTLTHTFVALEGAEDLATVMGQVHGRRTGLAKIGKDIDLQVVTQKQMDAFDTACLVRGRLYDLFGLYFKVSIEFFRRVIALFGILYRDLKEMMEKTHPLKLPRDEKGIFYTQYKVKLLS